MKILVSNDDGVYAQGLITLVDALKEIAEVLVMSPERNRSGASNSLTLDRPLRVTRLPNGFLSLDGTPTDCVHLALTGLVPEKFDMIVAGINAGSNLGDDILYSGTVAAAIEGRFLGVPAMAVSLAGRTASTTFHHYETAARIAKSLALKLSVDPLPAHTILNVNVPDLPFAEIRGIEVTRLGARHIAESLLKASDPLGAPVYWIGPAGAEADAGPGTDFHAVNSGRASITPLQLDMTHYKVFDQLSGWLDGLSM